MSIVSQAGKYLSFLSVHDALALLPLPGNMAEFIQSRRILDQWTSLFFLQQLLDALAYLKAKGILHEDIKGMFVELPPRSHQLLSLGHHMNCKLYF